MKKIIFVFLFGIIILLTNVRASLPLSGKLIIVDVGHGGKDVGTIHNNLYEKDLNLSISKLLEKELIRNGASALLIRDEDYDLSSPNSKERKRSDFNNRIKIINNSKANMYISIHINNLNDKTYQGAQVFYLNKNIKLAQTIQKELNTLTYPRSIKKMPDVYMYKRLQIPGVLIECGFISNTFERNKLQDINYQEELVKTITRGIINFYN